MNYIKVEFFLEPLLPAREILYADLEILGFESIIDTQKGAEAYMPAVNFTETILENLMVRDIPLQIVDYTVEEIEQQNWNAAWESQFQPISINEKCVIRAPFHEPVDVSFEILITPKMSFGTGHHETTFLMAQELFRHDLEHKRVMDMGCGTGVLAILAKKLGADYVEGVDIEEWAYQNSIENARDNQVPEVKFYHGDGSSLTGKQFDIILANINRNILMIDLPIYAGSLMPEGKLFLSGFYETDVEEIVKQGEKSGLKFVHSRSKNGWAMVQLSK